MSDSTTPAAKRALGNSGVSVAPIGFGAWAIGGPAYRNGESIGWGDVDDDESVAAISAAIDAGVTFIDTAPGYGAGHSERVIGRALTGRRDGVVVGTKFGVLIDEASQSHVREEVTPESIRAQCDGSLERLGIETIDLFQFHLGQYEIEKAEEVVETLEGLVDAGKIRSFGWSTDDPARVAVFARSPHCVAAQIRYNIVEGNPAVVEMIEANNLAAVIRSPLAMGALTGKFKRDSTFEGNDIRQKSFDFEHGKQGGILEAVERVRGVLTSGGRTVAQGALGWLLAKNPAFIPIPGIRTVAQAEENAGAIAHGALTPEQMDEIEATIGDLRESLAAM